MVISLLLLVIVFKVDIRFEYSTSGVHTKIEEKKKTAWVGAFLIITWYWMGVLGLYLVDGFTIALMPSLNTLGSVMIDFLRESLTNPGLSFLFAFIGGVSMWALQALYYIREILLYVYVYTMPIAFAFGYGNIPILSEIATGFIKRFVPLAVLPLPAAVVFKGYDLLYSQNGLTPDGSFLKYLVAASLPLDCSLPHLEDVQIRDTADCQGHRWDDQKRGSHRWSRCWRVCRRCWGCDDCCTVGPRAAAGQAVAQKVAGRNGSSDTDSTDENSAESNNAPSYRRTEYDRGIY